MEQHILGLMDLRIVEQNILDVICGRKDAKHHAYRAFIGLDHKNGLPTWFPFTTCQMVTTTNPDIIHDQFNDPDIKPTGIVLNNNLEGLMIQNIPCDLLINHFSHAGASENALSGFKSVIEDVMTGNVDRFVTADTTTSLILL